MNDVERLAEALRQANAELDVDPVELADAVDHAHGRLVRRLLLVATLSAVAAGLVLSGGLAASSAVKEHREKSSGNHHPKSKPQEEPPAVHDGGKGPGNGRRGGGKEKNKGKPHQPKKPETEEPEALPDLVVVEVTNTGVTVRNESDVSVEEPFYVRATVSYTKEETVAWFNSGLEEHESASAFEEQLTCSPGQEIVVFVDAGESIEEEDEKNEFKFPEPCEASGEEDGEGTTTTGKTAPSPKAVTTEEESDSGPG